MRTLRSTLRTPGPSAGRLTGLALVLCLAVPALPAFTEALAPLEAEVTSRKAEVDPGTKTGRKQLRALRRAENALASPSNSVGDDLRTVRSVAKRLARPFAGDAEIDGLLGGALDALAAAADADRERLEDLGGQPDDKFLWARLYRALDTFDARRAKADGARSATKRARLLERAWKAVAKGEKQLDLGPMPDFSLTDENDGSATAGQAVSPRDHRGKVAAYYFGRST